MFEQIAYCANNMMARIEVLVNENQAVESKSFVSECSLDVICTCAFGLQIKQNSPEFQTLKKSCTNLSPHCVTYVEVCFGCKMSQVGWFMKIKVFPTEVTEYFFKENVKYHRTNNIHILGWCGVMNTQVRDLLLIKHQKDKPLLNISFLQYLQ